MPVGQTFVVIFMGILASAILGRETGIIFMWLLGAVLSSALHIDE